MRGGLLWIQIFLRKVVFREDGLSQGVFFIR